MADYTKIQPDTDRAGGLAGEFWLLFLKAVNHRSFAGMNHSLRLGVARQSMYSEDARKDKSYNPDDFSNGKSCGCGEGESCDICEPPLEDICTIGHMAELCEESDPFDGIASLLAIVKTSDYLAAVEEFYAPVGNRPMELKAPPVINANDEEMKRAASAFYDYIQSVLDQYQVRVNEIPEAFDFPSLADMLHDLETAAKDKLIESVQNGITEAEDMLEKIFGQVSVMQEYIRVIKDTAGSPIGVLWCDDTSIQKVVSQKGGKVTSSYQLQPVAKRVDPCYFWATPDNKQSRCGRAVFMLRQLSWGELSKLKSLSRTTEKQKQAIDEIMFLDNGEPSEGHLIHSAHLFLDSMDRDSGLFDVIVGRGLFQASDLEEEGVSLPASKQNGLVEAEVWYSNGNVIYAKLLPEYFDRYGVFTTHFRSDTDSLWGKSLNDFIWPLAMAYEGAIKSMDESVGKLSGSVISLDTGVLDNPEQHIQNNEDGSMSIDLYGDKVFLFDSTEAGISPNFRGVPIHVDQMPTNLNQLLPVISTILGQIEILTGIPSIISDGRPSSSALRTDGSYRTAYRAANKKIASLIRKSRDNVLMKAVMLLYYSVLESGKLYRRFPIEAYPEALMDERLSLEIGMERDRGAILADLAPVLQRVPPERLDAVINSLAENVYGIEQLIPGAGEAESRVAPAQQTNPAA